MKNLIIKYKIILIIVSTLAIYSCQKNDEFIEPDAKMRIVNTNISLHEKLEVKNLGKGQKFSFWAGDVGHNYTLRTQGGNTGLPPNVGNDFNYYYLKSGVYTVYMIASSYDAENDKFVQKIDSATVTVTMPAVNNFTSFAIKNAWIGYNPLGEINNDSIFIRIAPVNRILYADSILTYIVNSKPPLFSVSVNLDYLTIYDENNNIYKGDGNDLFRLNLFKNIDANNVESNVRSFTVVDNATQNSRTYKVAAMLYPQIFTFSVGGDKALKFSEDGMTKLSDKAITTFYQTYADSMFIGIYLTEDQNIKKVTPVFSVTPNSVVTVNGVVQTSGVSEVDFSVNKPVPYKITRNFGSFTITTKVAVYYEVW
jgi:hypothetical protein